MPTRQLAILGLLALAFLGFVLFAATSPYWSTSDVIALAVFGVFFVLLAFFQLAVRGQQPVEGHRGLPRSFWVVFASFAAAFASAMLLGVLAMPFFGYQGFEFFLGQQSWWVLCILAALLYPFVRRRLL